ncbi:site-specific DNA recombinase [Parabacteroides sp. PFB2-12]|uniref:recombinase family protein n=1 Tax=unclassified Parabacteroides TaxID=2649774 RepID=UPI002475ACAB|nr:MULTISPECIES: recombinase family protein [unclassified Parabacteroides]MDH6343167.1 site-specific DNA recombinase [Parabacteroides sp. PM6-13]MDH6390811.1 site-specific DNA recombinase [Parabacteroides sp. PFB2-12]
MNKYFQKFAKGDKNDSQLITPGNAVLYNRVSTKKQEDNQSLELQVEACNRYAERYGLNIVKHFGGVFESAKSDKERKEFTKMLSFIRRNKRLNIRYVIVYRTNRFSRSGSTTIIEELEAMGIAVLSAMSNYNPKTASGRFNQRMELACAKQETDEKSQLTKDHGLRRLMEGRWIGKAPRGYEQKTTFKKQIITINQEGAYIRRAFHWKAYEKLSNEEIRLRLEKQGFKINKQKLSEMLKNPFYCGLMAHNFLQGRIVQGNHPPIVSEEVFLMANEVLNTKYTGGYEQRKQKEWAPLLGSLKCPCCGNNISASMSTKMKKKYNKEIYYYVCSRKGCKYNNRVVHVHESFCRYLSNLTTTDIDKDVLKSQLTKTFNTLTEDRKHDTQKLKERANLLKRQMRKMEEDWAIEGHPKKKDILWRQIEETEQKISQIDIDLANTNNSILNLNDFLEYGIDVICNPLKMWEMLNLSDKQKLQNVIFPKGFTHNKEMKHIEPIETNKIFALNRLFTDDFENKKREQNSENTDLSPSVLGAGIKEVKSYEI